jgi:DNA-binding beta-propeller fold protein YncE
MRNLRARVFTSSRSFRRSRGAIFAAAVALAMALHAGSAGANQGYELDAVEPHLSLSGEQPHGVAVDQVSQRVYVAIVTANQNAFAPGHVEQFESDGTPTAASPFTASGSALFSGVAVNPVTQGIYASQMMITTPYGSFGSWTMNQFSSSGSAGTSFSLTNTTAPVPQIAADATGQVYYPNDATNTVQVFNSAGQLQKEIDCGSCPGGAFVTPVSVAIDSQAHIYVVDVGTDRVVKFTHSGSSYSFDSVLQSGRGAAAVGVDPSSDDVFVGDYPGGSGYHIVAYDSSGAQLDDFGGGEFGPPPFEKFGAGQIAANATTHKLYVSDAAADTVWIFDRVTIGPPTATTDPAAPVGQVSATLQATVNANLHAVIDCNFEYTDQTDFEANGYANATEAPCSSKPSGSSDTAVSADVSGLSPDTTYRYRVVAENNGGSAEGGDETFTTLPVTPATVTTEPATPVTEVSATLHGKVNPQGGTVSDCHFEYGTSISYGQSIPCSTAVGPVTTDVTQKRVLAGLSPATTYHFRLVVTTNAGSAEGDDGEFTTLAPPPPPPPSEGSSSPPPATQPASSPPPATSLPLRSKRCKKGFRKKTLHGKTRCVKKRGGKRHSKS